MKAIEAATYAVGLALKAEEFEHSPENQDEILRYAEVWCGIATMLAAVGDVDIELEDVTSLLARFPLGPSEGRFPRGELYPDVDDKS